MHGYYGARIIENQNKRLLYSKCVPDIEMDHNSRRLCKTRTGWRRIVDGKMRIKITERRSFLFKFLALSICSISRRLTSYPVGLRRLGYWIIKETQWKSCYVRGHLLDSTKYFFFAFLSSDSLNSQFLFFRGLRIAGLRMSYLHNEFRQMELGKCFFNVSDWTTVKQTAFYTI